MVKKQVWVRVLFFIVGIALMISGIKDISEALGGGRKKDEASKDEEIIFIGDSVSDKDGVSFCVTDVKNATSIGEGIGSVSTENNFVIVTIKITNDGNESYDVNSLNFVLIEGEKKYECYLDALTALESLMYLDNINPGLSKEYDIVYETPFTSNEKDCRLRISNNAFSSSNYVYISLIEGEKNVN